MQGTGPSASQIAISGGYSNLSRSSPNPGVIVCCFSTMIKRHEQRSASSVPNSRELVGIQGPILPTSASFVDTYPGFSLCIIRACPSTAGPGLRLIWSGQSGLVCLVESGSIDRPVLQGNGRSVPTRASQSEKQARVLQSQKVVAIRGEEEKPHSARLGMAG